MDINRAGQDFSDLSLEVAPSHDEIDQNQNGSGMLLSNDLRSINTKEDANPLELQISQTSMQSQDDDIISNNDAHYSYHENQQLHENNSKQIAVDEHDTHTTIPLQPSLASKPSATKMRTLSESAQNIVPNPLRPPTTEASQEKKESGSLYKMGMLADDAAQQFLDEPSPELVDLYSKVAECRNLRSKYQSLSLQLSEQNPKNSPDWNVYPAPPKPSYNAETKTVISVVNKPCLLYTSKIQSR